MLWCPQQDALLSLMKPKKQNKTKNYPPHYCLPSPVAFGTHVNRVKSYHVRYTKISKPSLRWPGKTRITIAIFKTLQDVCFLRRSVRTLTSRTSRFTEAELSAASRAAARALLQTWPQGSRQTSREGGAHDKHAPFWLKLPHITREQRQRGEHSGFPGKHSPALTTTLPFLFPYGHQVLSSW